MKIVLFGATGMIGQRILREAAQRGHSITAVARDASRVNQNTSNVNAVSGDVLDPRRVAQIVAGHDAVISAYGPRKSDPATIVAAAHSLIAGLNDADIQRLIVVGGAASLETAAGVQLIDTPDFPEAFKATALAHRDALDVYRAEAASLDWTYVSPAAIIKPGTRTGTFRVGGEQLLTDEKGESHISAEDFAVAIIDELEDPKHIRHRITVAY